MTRIVQFLLAIVVTLGTNALVWVVAFNLVGVASNHRLPNPLEIIFSVFFFGIGLGQFIYILPLIFYLALQRRFTWLQGVIVGTILTILLNGGCWLLIIPSEP
jgi:hypothetical protein